MYSISQRERHAEHNGTTAKVSFQLDLWPASIQTSINGITDNGVFHPVGFAKTVYVKGIQYVAIYQQVAPVNGITDMAVVLVADASGNILYQCVERGAEHQFNSHHIPAFLFKQVNAGYETTPKATTVHTDASGAHYSIDAKCTHVWFSRRSVKVGLINSALWLTTDGAFFVQDYDKGHRVCQQVKHAELHTAVHHMTHAECPNLDEIPALPYDKKDIQDKYNLAWMRRQYKKHNASGLPIIHVHGLKSIFTYPNGTTVADNYVKHADGTVERPDALFVYDKAKQVWADSPVRLAEIERQRQRQQQQQNTTA
jgi:hypothetical protein